MGSGRACDVKLPVSKTQLAMKHKLVSASLPPNEMLPKTFFKIQATTEVITFPFEPVSQPRSKLCWSLEVSCLPRDFGNMDLPTCPYSVFTSFLELHEMNYRTCTSILDCVRAASVLGSSILEKRPPLHLNEETLFLNFELLNISCTQNGFCVMLLRACICDTLYKFCAP
jgi:hypothetical protein